MHEYDMHEYDMHEYDMYEYDMHEYECISTFHSTARPFYDTCLVLGMTVKWLAVYKQSGASTMFIILLWCSGIRYHKIEI